MSKCPQAFRLLLPTVAALLCVLPFSVVHAGMIGAMDELFTFRKDQKPLVAPHRGSIPPKLVVQPYYPNDQHVTWSNFYTRQDLQPQDYLSSSASKVMRPAPSPQEQAAQTPAQSEGGWPAIAEQAAQNAQAEAEAENNIMIGDPGASAMMANADSQVGRATRIGPAVEDWRNPSDGGIASRPGDYDYRAPVNVAETPGVAIADPKSSSSVSTIATTTASDDPRYIAQNAKGQVTRYAVQSGDTLSSISSQPAIYNTWKLWPLIYSANRRAIGGNPANLKRDERLDIPRDYTDEQAREAEKKAGRGGR